MATRGSALSRSVAWFREGNLDEVRIAFALVKEIVEGRLNKSAQLTLPLAKKTRKPKAKAPAVAAAAAGAVAASSGAAPASMSMREQERTLADA